MKKIFNKIIKAFSIGIGVLMCETAFSQSSDMQWTMHVDNLNIGVRGR